MIASAQSARKYVNRDLSKLLDVDSNHVSDGALG